MDRDTDTRAADIAQALEADGFAFESVRIRKDNTAEVVTDKRPRLAQARADELVEQWEPAGAEPTRDELIDAVAGDAAAVAKVTAHRTAKTARRARIRRKAKP